MTQRDDNNKIDRKKSNSSLPFLSIFIHADVADTCLMALGLIGAIGSGTSMPIITLMTTKFYNHFGDCHCSSPSSPEFIDKVNKYSLILVYLALGMLIASFLEGYCWTRTGERQASRIRARYLKAVLRQDVEYFDLKMNSSAEVINCISNDCSVIQDVISDKVTDFVSSVSMFFSSFIVAFALSWKLTVVVLPMVLLIVVPAIMYDKKLKDIVKKTSIQFNEASVIAEQAISSIRTVYSFAAERHTLAQYSAELDQTVILGLKQNLFKGLTIGFTGITFAIWAFIFWYGSHLVMYHGVEGGTIFGVGMANHIAFMSLSSGIPNLRYFSEASFAAQRIMKVILEIPKIDTESNEGETIENVIGNVEFRIVQFAYPSRPESLILNNFNLKVSAGLTVALVGSSGAGKSMIISVLERFYDPIGGEVLLDGVEIRSLNLKWLRSQIGLVSQEPALFATSIKENIIFGKVDASMEDIVAAAKVANAHDFISQLPQQYDTQVGEGGIQISGGQKQRIAIARAVIKSPKILLLDEATSALDTESERVVQAALDIISVNRTTIIIAHRLSTIRDADVIAVLQSGQVTELGSHDELMNIDGGMYASHVHLQQSNGDTERTEASTSSLRLKKQELSDKTKTCKPEGSSMSSAVSVDAKMQQLRPSVPSFKRLLMLNKPEWKNAIMGSVGAIFVGACQPVYGFTVGSIISVYFLTDHNELKSKVRIFCLVFVGISVIFFVMNGLQHYNFGAMGEQLTKRLREKMLSTILTFEVSWFDMVENSTGAICSMLAKDANVARSLVSDRMSLLIQTITTVTLTSTIALAISWRLAIVMIAVLPLMVAGLYTRKVLLKRLSSKAVKSQANICKLGAEAVTNFRTVTAFSLQDHIVNMFEVAQKEPRREIIKQSWFAGATFSVSMTTMVSTWAIDYWYGGKLISRELISAKALFQTCILLFSSARVIVDAASMTSDIAKGADSVDTIFGILDRKTCIEPEDSEGNEPKKLSGYIDIVGVHFSYPVRPDLLIFENFSLSIEAGKSTALVGHSGSGKSTIISLIERFYDPLKGTITIDNIDIKAYNLRSLRRHIGLVNQEPILFSGTIRQNITYGTDCVSETEIENATRAANAHEFISNLKDGYDTFCGGHGTQLSGGQKQRIAIARAILRNPEILLLDEATSALDSQSESIVQEALERLMVSRTSVVVAHRLSTIQNCDLIVVLDKGIVVEKGSHASLLAKGSTSAYYGLVSIQNDNES